MRKAIPRRFVLLSIAMLCTLVWSPIPLDAANEKRPQNAFFAFDNGAGQGKWTPQKQAATLKELGYAGIGYTGINDLAKRLKAFKTQDLRVFSLYVACHLAKEVHYSPRLKEAMKQLEGTGAMIWLTLRGKSNDRDAAVIVQEIADAADRHGVKIAIYPHHGFYIATTTDAVRLVKKIDRKNVGVTINLCHELKAGNVTKLGDIVKEAAPHLFLVSINGADRGPGGWDKLIRPLGQGNFDVSTFLKQLTAAGYTGPIGLQCYNVRGDQRENLKGSMAEWRKLAVPLKQKAEKVQD